MNRELDMCAMIENHSSPPNQPGYVGGDLAEMQEIVGTLDPKLVGVAFDLGHAIITHGDDWERHYTQLLDFIRVVYVKDVRRPDKFVPFGEGEFSRLGFFNHLPPSHCDALSIHIEYDWAGKEPKTAERMTRVLQHCREKIVEWCQQR